MVLLNYFYEHIRQLGNLGNIISERPDNSMMDHKEACQQSNRHESAGEIVRTKARKKVFRYR
jgi:hypothetical protein